ncbi:MAG: hexameric tyrosine-coordinated heme protein [Cyanobacteria bacterium P01_F01_bin.53]
MLIAVGQTVAAEFATIAAANNLKGVLFCDLVGTGGS